MEGWLAFVLVAVVAITVGNVVASRFGDPVLREAFMLGILGRIVGSTARFEVIERAYAGVGDAKAYFDYGRMAAASIAALDFDFVLHDTAGTGRWYGTHFIQSVTGFVVFFVGDSIRAAFLVFSLFAFVGLVLCVQAFEVAFGRASVPLYARVVWLWPSLWFWPSSIGKEALMILAFGLALRGYVGQGGAPRLGPLIAGVALAGAIRPHVAAVVALGVGGAEVLRGGVQTRAAKWRTVALALVLAGISIRFGLTQLGLQDADLEGIEEHFQFRAGQTAQGGSRITRATGVLAVPIGLVNVLARPFPWEAGGISLLSALELWSFWGLVVRRRRVISEALSGWRENRFLAIGTPVGFGMALLYGMAFANLGIIARQRVVLLPFLGALLAVQPRGAVTVPTRDALVRRRPAPRSAP